MFGYVRPFKQEMIVRELAKYRSVYCGICKQIGQDYGQIPRITVGYDITMLAVLLMSLDVHQPEIRMEVCIMNPVQRRPVIRDSDILRLCAALSVLLASYKAEDDIRDKAYLRGKVLLIALYRARRKASFHYRDYDLLIKRAMERLSLIEKGEPDPTATEIFAGLMQKIFMLASSLVTKEEKLIAAIGLLGRDLGSWIYLLDAIDDLKSDCDNNRWNPLALMEPESAREYAAERLICLEEAIDRTAALLPYSQDSGLMANIINLGLSNVREQVYSNGDLPRI